MRVALTLLDGTLTPLLETSCDAGERLMDALDDARSPLPFSCRSGTCASCLVEVIEGADLLAEPAPEEREVLRALAQGARGRLACRARIVPDGSGTIRLVSYRI